MQQVTQNLALNKCPHGFPAGTCPICSGHGGASRDKNKPRVSGEMSYNECMAAWIKIQAAKEAKIQERIDRLEASQQRLIFNRIMAGLVEKFNKISLIFDKVIQNIPQVIKTPVTFVVNLAVRGVERVVNVIINTTINIANFINSVGEKLASVYGEVKNFISAQIEKKIKKPIKIFLSFFAQTSEEDEEDKKKIEDLLKRIKNAIKLKRKKKNKDNKNAPN